MACASTRMPCRHRVLVLNDATHGRARGSGENHGEHHDLDGVNVHSAQPSGLVRLDGGETVEALGRLHCDVVFLGTNGLTPTHGLSTPDPDEAAVKRAMVRSARRKVVLADSSKVGATLLISFASLSDIDVLVTDSGLPEADRQQLVNEGLEVVVA